MRISLSSLLFLTFLFSTGLFAQPEIEWNHDYGDNLSSTCSAVLMTSDSNFVFAGEIENQSWDIFLVKIDRDGNEIWSQTYSNNDFIDICRSLIQTEDGGFALGGYSSSPDGSSMVLIKTNENGEEQWRQTYSYDYWNECQEIRQTDDGGYILAGSAISQDFSSAVMCIFRTDSTGDLSWTRIYSNQYHDYGMDLIKLSYGNYVCIGYSHTPDEVNPDDNVFLVNFRDDGGLLWRREIQAETYDSGISIVETDNGFAIAGHTGVDSTDFLLVFADSLGQEVSRNSYGGDDWETCHGIVKVDSAGYMIYGTTGSFGAGRLDYYAVRVDAEGDMVWSEAYGGARDDHGFSMIQTYDGGYLFGGISGSRGFDSKAWLLKTTADPAAVDDLPVILHPSSFILSSFPNPFNSRTTLNYTLSRPGNVTLSVYNPAGQLVTTLFDGWHTAGEFHTGWDAGGLPCGVYVVCLTHGTNMKTHNISIVK